LVTVTFGIFSGIALELGSGAGLVLAVAVGGVALFLLVLFLRMRPFIHRPKVTFRVEAKPVRTWPADTAQGPSGSDVLPRIRLPMTDHTELFQARSQWERLVQEAQSNEQLTSEQREAFIEEARKNIAKINTELGTD
jgi:hypothetical protein